MRGNRRTFVGAAVITAACFLAWEIANDFKYANSPREIFVLIPRLACEKELLRDIAVTFGEIFAGMSVSGIAAMALLLHVDRLPPMLRGSIDWLFQACQIAPIALLPDVFLSSDRNTPGLPRAPLYFVSIPLQGFSTAPEANRFLGGVLLAVDEALPYSGTAIVYGQMMRATAGLVFLVVVAGATYQAAETIAGFLSLVLSIAAFSMLFRRLAKVGLMKRSMIGSLDWAQAGSVNNSVSKGN